MLVNSKAVNQINIRRKTRCYKGIVEIVCGDIAVGTLMDFSSEVEKIKSFETADNVILEKVRWSLRQRLRKQMQLLNGDFFDAVDDFLFSGGQQGQFGQGANYLDSMRELRAKQNLFEEKFLDTVAREIKASFGSDVYPTGDFDDSPSGELDAALEQVEIDLALQSMSRKACKVYAPFIKQIDSIQAKVNYPAAEKLIEGEVLIHASLSAFTTAHQVFSIPLDIRLAFLKLFEHHFLLKMEKLYLDTISIINNLSDSRFVEKLYSSSSAFRTRITHHSSHHSKLNKKRQQLAQLGSQRSKSADTAVDHLIESFCCAGGLPEFIERMIRTRWRAVMFIIGLNRGNKSVEWNEAKHTVTLLISCLTEEVILSTKECEAMFDQIRQGFVLIRLSDAEQDEFLSELKAYLSETGNVASCGNREPEGRESAVEDDLANNIAHSKDASISPAGERILDKEDLDDLAQLLGNGEEVGFKSEVKQSLAELLPVIDSLGEHASVKYRFNDVFEDCVLCRSITNPELYVVSNKTATICINRSRLGLALALQEGELKLPHIDFSQMGVAGTIIQSENHTRH